MFGRLMPLVVDLRDVVSESCMKDCGDFMELLVRQQVGSLHADTTATDGIYTCSQHARLMSLIMKMDWVLQDAPLGKDILFKCEIYLQQVMKQQAKKRAHSRTATRSSEPRPMKRREVDTKCFSSL